MAPLVATPGSLDFLGRQGVPLDVFRGARELTSKALRGTLYVQPGQFGGFFGRLPVLSRHNVGGVPP
jgi:hypothetical protein